MDMFESVSLIDLAKVVSSLRPSYCPSDSLPSKLFKDVFDTVRPTILTLINTYLLSGCIPSFFKHAVVQPLIKKLGPSSFFKF